MIREGILRAVHAEWTSHRNLAVGKIQGNEVPLLLGVAGQRFFYSVFSIHLASSFRVCRMAP